MGTIFDVTNDFLGDAEVTKLLTAIAGVDAEESARASHSSLVWIIITLTDRAKAVGGGRAIEAVLDDDDGTVLRDPIGYLAGQKAALGNEQLRAIAGNDWRGEAAEIAADGATSPAVVRRLAPIVTPLVLGELARRRAADSLNVGAVGKLLAEERLALRGRAEGWLESDSGAVAPNSGAAGSRTGGAATGRLWRLGWLWLVIGGLIAMVLFAWALSLVAEDVALVVGE